MSAATRPVRRFSAWPQIAGLVAVALVPLAVSTSPTAAVVMTAAAGVIAAAALVDAVRRVRRAGREHEESLLAWGAERAAAQERLRIARELHDLASHGLGLITLRAAAARRAGADDRAAALTDIEGAARQATAELRRLLAVLRSPDEAASRAPSPGFADLDALVGKFVGAGLQVSMALENVDLDPDGDVTAVVQATAVAVVREGLTNVARHAGPTAARVRLRRSTDAGTLEISVQDDGTVAGWHPERGAGAGIVGLRERVEALGGEVIGAAAGPGFLLRAHVPVEPWAP